MTTKQKIRKITITSLMPIILSTCFNGDKAIKYLDYDHNIDEYIKNNLQEIIMKEWEIFGMQDSILPKVAYFLPSSFQGQYRDSVRIIAGYSQEKNTIYISNDLSVQDTSKINDIQSCTVNIKYKDKIQNKTKDTMLRIIAHEGGHFILDRLSEIFRHKDFPYDFKFDRNKKIGIKLVSEGLAKYLETKFTNEQDTFSDSLYPKDIESFMYSNTVFYGGFHLVKEIADNHGIKGIIYLMENPPSNKELMNLPKYRKNTLRHLSYSKD